MFRIAIRYDGLPDLISEDLYTDVLTAEADADTINDHVASSMMDVIAIQVLDNGDWVDHVIVKDDIT